MNFTERGNSDVLNDASADNTRLGNATISCAALCAKDGKGWKRELDQTVDELFYAVDAVRNPDDDKVVSIHGELRRVYGKRHDGKYMEAISALEGAEIECIFTIIPKTAGNEATRVL